MRGGAGGHVRACRQSTGPHITPCAHQACDCVAAVVRCIRGPTTLPTGPVGGALLRRAGGSRGCCCWRKRLQLRPGCSRLLHWRCCTCCCRWRSCAWQQRQWRSRGGSGSWSRCWCRLRRFCCRCSVSRCRAATCAPAGRQGRPGRGTSVSTSHGMRSGAHCQCRPYLCRISKSTAARSLSTNRCWSSLECSCSSHCRFPGPGAGMCTLDMLLMCK